MNYREVSDMTLEEQLKQEIIRQHGSVLAFSKAIGLKNSTIDSMLTRGLYNAGVGRVMQIFDALGIDTESLAVGRLIYVESNETEKAPAPSEDSTRAISVEALEAMLIQGGFIRPDEDLSDDDLDFLLSVGRIVETWFRKRQKHGGE